MFIKNLVNKIMFYKSRTQCVSVLVTNNRFSSQISQRHNSVQNRMLNFVRSHDQYKDKAATPGVLQLDATFYNDLNSADYDKIKDIVRCYELPDFIFQANLLRNSCTGPGINYALLCAASLYSQQIATMDKIDAFKCFDALLYVYERQISKFKFSWDFINKAEELVANKVCNFQELILIMFYTSMVKQTQSTILLIQQCLDEILKNPSINNMSIDELCIIARATFRTSVKINSTRFLEHVYERIDKNLHNIISDTGYFVTIIKALRLAKFYNFEVMDKIAKHLTLEILEQMNFIAKAHILALYADALYIDDKFFEMIKSSCVRDLSFHDTLPLDNRGYLSIRIKDISRFLWAVSYLGDDLPKSSLETMNQILKKSLSRKKHFGRYEDIVSSLLSLWILGHLKTSLFELVVTELFMLKLKERDFYGVNSRLTLLLQCIRIEKPEILQEHHADWTVMNLRSEAILERNLKRRTTLNQVYNSIECLSSVLKLNVTCDCCIPDLNILGIVVSSNEGDTLNIEVLDESVCRHGTFKPFGLMKLKLRLLKSMKRKTLVITADQFDDSGDFTDMFVFLEEKLKENFYPDRLADDCIERR